MTWCIVGECRTMISNRCLEMNPISEEEHKRQSSLLQQKLRALAKEKQDLWRKHHQQTIAMVSEIAGELVLKTIDLYKKQAI